MTRMLCLILLLGSISVPYAQTILSDTSFQIVKAKKKKSWYVPALEVATINVLVNRFDLYILQEDFADVNFESWKSNFKTGFVSDGDSFSTNFFAHPYHGSMYYNTARSSGYNYWQSMPFVVGGSLMWEFLGEIEPPSEIDINTTILGGIYLGEMTNRVSRALLRDNKRRPYKAIRNIAATILNPIGSFNSWISGDIVYPFRSPNTETHLIRSQLSSGIAMPLRKLDRRDASVRYHLNYTMLYGNVFQKEDGFKPFDAFLLRASIDLGGRTAETKFFFNISSNASVYRKKLNDNSIFSISQHYDFLENQAFNVGAMGITADYTLRYKSDSWRFVGTAKAGIIPFGSSNSEIVDYLNEEVDEETYKEYVYGRGAVFKLEYIIFSDHYGRFTSAYNHWYINTENYTQGIENSNILRLNYYYPIGKNNSIGVEYLGYRRFAGYENIEGFENIKDQYSELKLQYTKVL